MSTITVTAETNCTSRVFPQGETAKCVDVTLGPNSLSVARSSVVAAKAGSVVLFAGGEDTNGDASDVVNIYHTGNSAWTTSTLPGGGVYSHTGTGVGTTHVFFAGGEHPDDGYSSTVNIYHTGNSAWTTSTLPGGARISLASTSVDANNVALFGGGEGAGLSSAVDIYHTGNSAWTSTTLPMGGAMLLAATSLGTKAIFAGGYDYSSAITDIDIYDTNTSAWLTSTNLSAARYRLVGVSSSTHAFFAGGTNGSTESDVIDIYNGSTWSTGTLSDARKDLSAANVDASGSFSEKVVFAGGDDGSIGSRSTIIDTFDKDGSNANTQTLTTGRGSMAGIGVDTRAFFAGGTDGSSVSSVNDIFNNYPATSMQCTSGYSDSEVLRLAVDGTSGAYAGKVYLGMHHWNSGVVVANPPVRIGCEETSTGSYDANLLLQTRSSGQDIEPSTRMIITSAGNVGIGTTSPAGILDITSTTAAFLPPRMTTTQRNAISSPAAGMVVYDTTLNNLCFYNGSSWRQVTNTAA
jgi:hypothetical protein